MDVYAIESMVRQLGAERISVSGSKVQCSCLLAQWTHSSGRDTSPSMVIFVEGKHGDPIYSCLGCHEKGSLRDLLCFIWMKTRQSTLHWIDILDGEGDPVAKPEFRRARKKLAGFDYAKARQRRLATKVETITKRDGKWWDYMAIAEADKVTPIPEDEYAPHAGSVPRYALDRGLTIETCKAWELGHDERMKRLLFPMRNRAGQIVAISGRLYACPRCSSTEVKKVKGERDRCGACNLGLPPKYLHSEGFKRNLFLYGENRQNEGSKHVYVVEGNLDAPLMWQVGYRPVVALLGSSPGAAQVEKLVAWWDAITVVGDGDKAGYDLGVKLKKAVNDRVPVKAPRLPDGMDPGKLAVEAPEVLEEILGPPVDKTVPMG